MTTLTQLEIWLEAMHAAAQHAAHEWEDRDSAQANHFSGMAIAYSQVLTQIARFRGPFAPKIASGEIPEGPHRVSFDEPEASENG